MRGWSRKHMVSGCHEAKSPGWRIECWIKSFPLKLQSRSLFHGAAMRKWLSVDAECKSRGGTSWRWGESRGNSMGCACRALGAATLGMQLLENGNQAVTRISWGNKFRICATSGSLTSSASVNFTVWRLNHVHLPEKQECFDFYLVLPVKLKILSQPHPQENLQKFQAFTETTQPFHCYSWWAF